MSKIAIRLVSKAEVEREEEALEALRRFRKAEESLDAAEVEYGRALGELNDKLKAAGWPLMVIAKR